MLTRWFVNKKWDYPCYNKSTSTTRKSHVKIIYIPASLSTAHSFTTILSKENLKKYARDCGALKRDRKFSISDYILTSLSQMSKSTEKSEFTLRSVHDAYLSGWQKLGRITFLFLCTYSAFFSFHICSFWNISKLLLLQ